MFGPSLDGRSGPLLDPWSRLYTLAILLESQIFPGVELCDESPDCAPYVFMDIWKGKHRGEPVCIKAVRTRNRTRLKEIKSVCGFFFLYRRRTECTSYQTLCREINGCKSISHPNLLPVIDVSETLFPFCIMSPWMPDGNIRQYLQANPNANRLTLVRVNQLGD
jgi:serine/threonine protein kinase